MSIENIFKCCKRNNILQAISGLGVGLSIGYNLYNLTYSKDKITDVSDNSKPSTPSVENIVDKNLDTIDTSDIDEVKKNFIENIQEYMGNLFNYTIIAGFVLIPLGQYIGIVRIRDILNYIQTQARNYGTPPRFNSSGPLGDTFDTFGGDDRRSTGGTDRRSGGSSERRSSDNQRPYNEKDDIEEKFIYNSPRTFYSKDGISITRVDEPDVARINISENMFNSRIRSRIIDEPINRESVERIRESERNLKEKRREYLFNIENNMKVIQNQRSIVRNRFTTVANPEYVFSEEMDPIYSMLDIDSENYTNEFFINILRNYTDLNAQDVVFLMNSIESDNNELIFYLYSFIGSLSEFQPFFKKYPKLKEFLQYFIGRNYISRPSSYNVKYLLVSLSIIFTAAKLNDKKLGSIKMTNRFLQDFKILANKTVDNSERDYVILYSLVSVSNIMNIQMSKLQDMIIYILTARKRYILDYKLMDENKFFELIKEEAKEIIKATSIEDVENIENKYNKKYPSIKLANIDETMYED